MINRDTTLILSQQTSDLFLMSFEIAPIVGQIACARMLLNIQDVMRISLPDPHTPTTPYHSYESRRRSMRQCAPQRASFYMAPLPLRDHRNVTTSSLGTEAIELGSSKELAKPELPASPPGVQFDRAHDHA
jgi:hypothetical protein